MRLAYPRGKYYLPSRRETSKSFISMVLTIANVLLFTTGLLMSSLVYPEEEAIVPDVTVFAAGDIARCPTIGAELTAQLIEWRLSYAHLP